MAGLEGRRVQEAAREPSKTVSGGPRQCYTCGKPGHLAKDCSLEEAVMPFSQCTESRGRPKLTKNQTQGNKRKRFPRMQEDPAEHPLEVSREDLVDLQKTDKSLEPVWRQVQENPDGVSSRGGFFTRDGVLVSYMDASRW